mgnify:CR=1 FL=1
MPDCSILHIQNILETVAHTGKKPIFLTELFQGIYILWWKQLIGRNRNDGNELTIVNNCFQIWNPALQHVSDMTCIDGFLTSCNFDDDTVIVAVEIILYIIHMCNRRTVCGNFAIQQITDKIFIVKSTRILNECIFYDLLIDIFFLKSAEIQYQSVPVVY